jgi:hypothetical protein
VINEVQTDGPSLTQPVTIVRGRLARFGENVDF